MEVIGSLLLIIAAALIVGLFVAQPFFNKGVKHYRGEAAAPLMREHQRSFLLAERDRVLNALNELDFDFALGKVPQEDYPLQRAVLLRKGAEVLRKLDEIGASVDGVGEGRAISASGSAEERIEAAVAARRADAGRRASLNGEAVVQRSGNAPRQDALEELIASRKRQRKESSAGFCPRCGRPVQKSDRFCSKCGADL